MGEGGHSLKTRLFSKEISRTKHEYANIQLKGYSFALDFPPIFSNEPASLKNNGTLTNVVSTFSFAQNWS